MSQTLSLRATAGDLWTNLFYFDKLLLFMTAPQTGMDEFRFENTLKLTEEQYTDLWSVLPKKGPLANIRLIAIIIVGIICLFSAYTLLLGLVLWGVVAIAIMLPAIIPGGARHIFRQHRYLRDTLTYGVSDQKLWVRGAKIDASVSWSMLVVWREINGALILSPSGIPPIYLSLARLNEKGLYDRVKDLATRNAPEYNKARPKMV